jgi:hypothetical protein
MKSTKAKGASSTGTSNRPEAREYDERLAAVGFHAVPAEGTAVTSRIVKHRGFLVVDMLHRAE